jgi:hypothetical protein
MRGNRDILQLRAIKWEVQRAQTEPAWVGALGWKGHPIFKHKKVNQLFVGRRSIPGSLFDGGRVEHPVATDVQERWPEVVQSLFLNLGGRDNIGIPARRSHAKALTADLQGSRQECL